MSVAVWLAYCGRWKKKWLLRGLEDWDWPWIIQLWRINGYRNKYHILGFITVRILLLSTQSPSFTVLVFMLWCHWLNVDHMSISAGPLTADWPLPASGRQTGLTCWCRKGKNRSQNSPPLSHFSMCLHLSVLLCLFLLSLTFFFFFFPHCVSLQGDAGRARSVWFRAVSRRRIGSIYSPVCSRPRWLWSLCLFFCFYQYVIHLSNISWCSFNPVLPSDEKKKTLPFGV